MKYRILCNAVTSPETLLNCYSVKTLISLKHVTLSFPDLEYPTFLIKHIWSEFKNQTNKFAIISIITFILFYFARNNILQFQSFCVMELYFVVCNIIYVTDTVLLELYNVFKIYKIMYTLHEEMLDIHIYLY